MSCRELQLAQPETRQSRGSAIKLPEEPYREFDERARSGLAFIFPKTEPLFLKNLLL